MECLVIIWQIKEKRTNTLLSLSDHFWHCQQSFDNKSTLLSMHTMEVELGDLNITTSESKSYIESRVDPLFSDDITKIGLGQRYMKTMEKNRATIHQVSLHTRKKNFVGKSPSQLPNSINFSKNTVLCSRVGLGVLWKLFKNFTLCKS